MLPEPIINERLLELSNRGAIAENLEPHIFPYVRVDLAAIDKAAREMTTSASPDSGLTLAALWGKRIALLDLSARLRRDQERAIKAHVTPGQGD
jgi:hypothetical protein